MIILHDVLNGIHEGKHFLIRDDIYNRQTLGANLARKLIMDINQYLDLNGIQPHQVETLFTSLDVMRMLQPTELRHKYLFDENSFSQSVYSKYVKTINADQIFLRCHQLPRMRENLVRMFGDRVFIRPDSGRKHFTGFVVDLEDEDVFRQELSATDQTSSVMADHWISVSSVKKIHDTEWRFWVVEGRVVMVRSYNWFFIVDQTEAPSDIVKHVENAIRNIPYVAYTIDATYADDNPNIVELNCINTSGLYGAEVTPIVNAVKDVDWVLFD